MFYGLARDKDGKSIIIRDLRSKHRLNAEREARRYCFKKDLKFDGVYLARNFRQKQGEIKQNYTLPRERAKALAAWRG